MTIMIDYETGKKQAFGTVADARRAMWEARDHEAVRLVELGESKCTAGDKASARFMLLPSQAEVELSILAFRLALRLHVSGRKICLFEAPGQAGWMHLRIFEAGTDFLSNKPPVPEFEGMAYLPGGETELRDMIDRLNRELEGCKYAV